MKKSLIRTLYAVLYIAFMFTFMEGVALADESGEWGNLTWKLDSKGTLTISGTGAHEIPHGLHQDRGPAAGFRGAENMRLSGRDQQEVSHFYALSPLPDGLDAASLAAVEPFIFVGMHMLTAA